MSKSKAHKFWNKFTGWASHEGQVKADVLQAMDEFLVNPNRIPEDARQQVGALFEGWFLLERRLTRANATPIDLFIRSHERKLKDAELNIYRKFAEESQFGFFRVEDRVPGESLELRLMPDGDLYHVLEVEGSKAAEKGAYLITRIMPFEDHWAMPSLIGAYPADYSLDRIFGQEGRKLYPGELRPRHVLTLFMPKVDWAREGLPRVKARLAMLLQRWGVRDITASMLDEDINAAHQRRDVSHSLFKPILSRAPSADQALEAVEVLTAWWNLTLPTTAADNFPRGPKEMALLKDLQRVVGDKLADAALDDPEKVSPQLRSMTKEWLNAPQKELGGKTPLEVIGEERKALGNPREELGISLFPSRLEVGSSQAKGAALANQGRDYLLDKDAVRALECFEKAYVCMKDDRGAQVFRVLGNMATAYVMLGQREKALDMLRAALKANPDYDLARNNLNLLERMTPKEFARKHRSGFFDRMDVISED